MSEKSFAGACKEFFGLKDHQTLSEFAAELRELTDDDRVELAPMLSKELGVHVVPRAKAAV